MYKELKNKKIALVHDYLMGIGGAERVLKVLHEMFPEAPIYTVVYDEKFVGEFFSMTKRGLAPLAGPGPALSDSPLIRATFLQKLPKFLRKRYKYFSFLIPSAVESLDLSEFDVVISSCSAFCKGVITRPDTIHICYCHTPTRFLWDWTHEYSKLLEGGGISGVFGRIAFHFLRLWDRTASNRVDHFVANSKYVAQRIKKYYDRDARVIYPPVENEGAQYYFPADLRTVLAPLRPAGLRKGTAWSQARCVRHSFSEGGSPGGRRWAAENEQESQYRAPYYLIVSQLRPYKQIDIAIEAFKKLSFPLVIIGQGDDEERLKKTAKGFDNIKFLGFQPEEVLPGYYKSCKAFIFPGEEDFGIVMVEAMSFGKPVLALRRGGAKEIVIEGMTGEFFDDPHPVVLADGVRRLLENYELYSPILIKKYAEKFSREKFEGEMLEFVERCCRI